MRSCWMLQTTGFHICKQKTIDNCTWNLSLKWHTFYFVRNCVRWGCYLLFWMNFVAEFVMAHFTYWLLHPALPVGNILLSYACGKNMISWFYAYVEHIEIKTKTVNIIHFPYLDLSQNVKIRDVPFRLYWHLIINLTKLMKLIACSYFRLNTNIPFES
jgi:hypothetical protein